MPRVLILDDDDMVRQLVHETLTGAGFDVRTAKSGYLALEVLRSEHFDLIITDIVRPEKDGLETIQEVLRGNPGMKILAMSGGGSYLPPTEDLTASRLLGAYRTLFKPVSPHLLVNEVHATLAG